MAVAAGTTELTCNHNTLPPHVKPTIAVAARRTGKHTSDLAKIGLLICRPGSGEVAVRLQGGDSTRGGQGGKAAGGG
jgi:hypothetical protein